MKAPITETATNWPPPCRLYGLLILTRPQRKSRPKTIPPAIRQPFMSSSLLCDVARVVVGVGVRAWSMLPSIPKAGMRNARVPTPKSRARVPPQYHVIPPHPEKGQPKFRGKPLAHSFKDGDWPPYHAPRHTTKQMPAQEKKTLMSVRDMD